MLTYRQKPCPSRRQHRRDSQTLQNRQTKQSETLGQQIRGVVMWSFTTLNGLSTSPSEQITTITYKCQLRLLIQPVSAKNPFDTPCRATAQQWLIATWSRIGWWKNTISWLCAWGWVTWWRWSPRPLLKSLSHQMQLLSNNSVSYSYTHLIRIM